MTKCPLILGLLMLLVSAANAQTSSILTADFQSSAGVLQAIEAGGITLRTEAGQTTRIPWDQLVLWERPKPAKKGLSPFLLLGRDGRKLVGQPVNIANDKLTWSSDILGQIVIPIEQVKGIVRTGAVLPEQTANDDLVVMNNRDQLRGIIGQADAANITLQKDANQSTLAWKDVQSVLLADVGASTAKPGKLRLQFVDGSVWLADSMTGSPTQVQITSGDTSLKISLDALTSIENDAGRAIWLARLKPQEAQYAPFTRFSDLPTPPFLLLDQVTLQSRVYRNVIAIKPKCVLKYRAPAAGVFRLQYACDKPGAMTEMSLTILLGESRKVHEQKGIRSAIPGAPVTVEVAEGDIVTLQVGYGANLDVQDCLLLLDAAFVRSDPKPR